MTLVTDPGVDYASASFVDPVATDNAVVAELSCSHEPGFFTVGITTVTCTAKDSSNNINTCFFTVSIDDVEAPGFLSSFLLSICCDSCLLYLV